MKNIKSTLLRSSKWLVIIALLIAFVSCDPNPNANSNNTHIIPTDSVVSLGIKTVKNFYYGENIKLNKANNFDQINISGSLISDPKVGNTPKGYLILQHGDSGIALLLQDSTDQINYTPGQVLQVNVQSGTLKKINGNLVITGLIPSDITSTGKYKSISPRSVTLKELANNFEDYSETLIKLNIVTFNPSPSSGSVYKGAKSLDDGTSEPGVVKLYTFPNSELANKPIDVNSTSTFTAIAMHNVGSKDNIEKQVWLPNKNDIGTVKIIPSQSPFIITGFLANPTGYDQDLHGDTRSYLPRPLKGGFQYIQFMALKDIDFSKTPYSIVLMISYSDRPGATANGWAAGKFRTAKFNLESGQAAQGTFFYVGSGEKLIDGYSPDGLSTDISNANWIRTTKWWKQSYDSTIGDPFSNGNIGHSAKSWLDHRTSPGSDAIAVFKGTTVKPNSVPVDAIFLNQNIDGTINKAKGWGFHVPKNDLYNPANPGTGNPQPLFGEGTNTYAVPIDIVNGNGVWVALGGIVSEKGFISKRNHPTGIQLSVEPGVSQLSDIQKGKGITVFRK